ncbi:NAD-dependent epimerase/dehydratase family protein [Cyanobacterium aponinum FACHB-4101]|uniref:NAD-dependent epimerase/dehydratase family protein n=1 Tax=Cyanobacterium aponinum TaxID=379064 RepID=UPI0016800C76|nr:NAD-dependent epimerase/dehydratase family protein [Cyanobacterium aponinum]MBD2393735.1 NAD-dependent epimerase/dehydratase family protein [Cyanobacterium aponinum FACHB-4101]
MKVIIIGGNGFVGSAYKRFCEKNSIDHLIVNRHNYHDYIGTKADILINANGNSKKFLATQEPLVDFDASVRSLRQSLIDFPCDKYVFLSSCDVYSDCSSYESTKEDVVIDISKQSPYGFHKYLAELCVQHCHHDWLIFRMGGFVGENLKKNAIFDILWGDHLWLHPESKLQYINTDIAAMKVMEIIKKGYSQEIFNLCGNGVIELQEVLNMTNREVEINTEAKPVHYEVNIDKIQSVTDIPSTRDAVIDFVQSNR